MKRFTLITLLTAIVLLFRSIGIGFTKEDTGYRLSELHVAIISDIHVMAPELLVNEGPAFDDYLRQDRKMLKESPLILDELTRQLIDLHPQVVLLTGDITKDGEEASHRYVREHCVDLLQAHGIAVLVIPGNHDINNPHAVAYDGQHTQRVKTITPEEFAHIYADYGYGNALARDEHSLSYVYQLTPQVRVLALDACEYELNDFDQDLCRHEGRLKPETLAFAEEQMADARRQGMYVIGMMHHGLIEHWKYQERLIPGYVVDDHKHIARRLSRAGLEVIFTGHAHTQDIVCEHGIYDIETGSTVSYPSPYRTAELKGTTLSVHTHHVAHIDYDTGGVDLQLYGREATAGGFRSIAGPLLPDHLPQDLRERALAFGAEAMCNNYAGDEELTYAERTEINEICRELRRYSWKWSFLFGRITRSVLHDKNTADNELLIDIDRRRRSEQ